jgi:selenocysteine-specific elongation factor
MSTKHFILATAGHVDHGKSALVKALTGTDPDRLPEEKARGITIDLGFAHLMLASEEVPESSFHVGIVDVPGHEDFVKNMVAGVGSIDLALLVVAADDGWMPQTEEHLQILTYLRVNRAVVAVTKIDLVEFDKVQAFAEVRESLRDTAFANAPIVGTSVTDNHGIAELKATLAQELSKLGTRRDIQKPRVPVDRVFTLRGIGTVVTGTLTGGSLQRGQTVVIQPSGTTTRIRTLQNYNSNVATSEPGARTAIGLPDVSAAKGPQSIHRGDVVTLPTLGKPSRTLDVLIEKSARLINTRLPAARPLKNGTYIRLHHGSCNVPGHVLFLDGTELLSGSQAIAQIRSEAPVFSLMGDRFIIRDWQAQATLAGGLVLDPDADPKQFGRQAQREYLEALARPDLSLPDFIMASLTRDKAVKVASLLVKSLFSATEIAEAVRGLADQGKILVSGDWVADFGWWQAVRTSALSAIDSEHRQHPNRAGLSVNGLRSLLLPSLPILEVFDALVADLCRSDFDYNGVVIRRRTHRPKLPPHLELAGVKLRAALKLKPLDPPSRKELAPDVLSRQALSFLLETQEAIDLGGEVVMLSEHFATAVGLVKRLISQNGAATVSEIRQAMRSSRRVVVPFLERLDREKITHRQGDKRILAGDR